MSSKPWVAFGPSWIFQWSPEPPHLEGSDNVIAAVEAWLARADTIAPTPTSTPVPSVASNSVAVYSALHYAVTDVSGTSPDAPHPPPVPDGAVA